MPLTLGHVKLSIPRRLSLKRCQRLSPARSLSLVEQGPGPTG